MDASDAPRFHRHFVVLAVILSAAFLVFLGYRPRPRSSTEPSAPYRQESEALRRSLADVAVLLDDLHEAGEARQRELMRTATGWLERILLRLREVEAAFYDDADRAAGGSPGPTEALRHGLATGARWLNDLRVQAEQAEPDPDEFARRGGRLLGLIEVHLQAEAAVVLPILDRTLGTDEFRRRLQAP
jgi:hypothetical protein